MVLLRSFFDAGSVPSALGGLVALETLDARFNRLTGKCDTYLQQVDRRLDSFALECVSYTGICKSCKLHIIVILSLYYSKSPLTRAWSAPHKQAHRYAWSL